MATEAIGGETPTLFLRKATGRLFAVGAEHGELDPASGVSLRDIAQGEEILCKYNVHNKQY